MTKKKCHKRKKKTFSINEFQINFIGNMGIL